MKYTIYFSFLCIISQPVTITASKEVALSIAKAKESAEIRAKRIQQRLLQLVQPLSDNQARMLNYIDEKTKAIATESKLPTVVVTTIMGLLGRSVRDVQVEFVSGGTLNLKAYGINSLDGLLDIPGIRGVGSLDLSCNELSEESDFTVLKELPALQLIGLWRNKLLKAPAIAADMPQLRFHLLSDLAI